MLFRVWKVRLKKFRLGLFGICIVGTFDDELCRAVVDV
jgi:hypothetical protein